MTLAVRANGPGNGRNRDTYIYMHSRDNHELAGAFFGHVLFFGVNRAAQSWVEAFSVQDIKRRTPSTPDHIFVAMFLIGSYWHGGFTCSSK